MNNFSKLHSDMSKHLEHFYGSSEPYDYISESDILRTDLSLLSLSASPEITKHFERSATAYKIPED